MKILYIIALFLPSLGYSKAHVSFFTNHEKKTLVVKSENNEAFKPGDLLKVYRKTGMQPEIEIGTVKVKKTDSGIAIAQVITNGTEWATKAAPEYPHIMAGDVVKKPFYRISLNQHATPRLNFFYHEIFVDPKSTPLTFEMTTSGRHLLKNKMKSFEHLRFSKLVIKGYTDHNGHSDANQVESLQRAVAVKQFLVDEMGFIPERVVAIGLGELNQNDKSMISGYRRNNRRIEINVATD